MRNLYDLATLIGRHAPADGMFRTAIPGVELYRTSAPGEPVQAVYEPSVCILAQGRKRAVIGGEEHYYDASSHFIVGLDLLIIGGVIEASEAEPYLCFKMPINKSRLAGFISHHPGQAPASSLGIAETRPELIDAVCRFLELLEKPDQMGVLAPLYEQEILYHLYNGAQGATLYEIATTDSTLDRIGRAISYLKENFHEAVTIEQLADLSGMSVSAFYQHFRRVAKMSPLQFRTRLRAQEVRRLMLMEGISAANAGFRVGYDSPSQLSREYSRVFGQPPLQDIRRLKAEALQMV